MKLICYWTAKLGDFFYFSDVLAFDKIRAGAVWSKKQKQKTTLHLVANPRRRTGLCSGVPFLIGKKITRVLRMRKSWRRLAFGVVLIDVGFCVRHSASFSGKWRSSEAQREFFLELILKMLLESDTGQIKASAPSLIMSGRVPLSSYACPDHLTAHSWALHSLILEKMELKIKNQFSVEMKLLLRKQVISFSTHTNTPGMGCF